jgi:hypothetical protein
MKSSAGPAKKPTTNAQVAFEHNFVEEKRRGFDAYSSRAWTCLTNKYGPRISQEKLLSLAQVAAFELRLGLPREWKRRKEMLVRWFDENLDIVWPFIQAKVVVSDTSGHPIDCAAPQRPPGLGDC